MSSMTSSLSRYMSATFCAISSGDCSSCVSKSSASTSCSPQLPQDSRFRHSRGHVDGKLCLRWSCGWEPMFEVIISSVG